MNMIVKLFLFYLSFIFEKKLEPMHTLLVVTAGSVLSPALSSTQTSGFCSLVGETPITLTRPTPALVPVLASM